MDVNSILGAQSPEVIYVQRFSDTSKDSLININGHTPYDDDEAVTYSQSDFHKSVKSFRYAQDEKEDNYRFGIETNYKPSTVSTGVETPEFPPKTVFTFQNSTVSSSKDPVKGLLGSYDARTAMVVKNAKKAYNNAVGITKDPVAALNLKQVEFKKSGL